MATRSARSVVLRPMSTADIEAATELSREQAWPHREDDWQLFLTAGEGLVAEQDGRVIGTVMAWRYGHDFASLGMVIVANKAQGQGIGRRLMEAMLGRLDGRSVLLNATEQGLPLYAKLGFTAIGTIHQHHADVPAMPLAELLPGERVRPAGRADDWLGQLYSRASGTDRQALLRLLSSESKTVALTRDDVPVGFAQVRRFGRGRLVGPVVAPDPHGARTLILHWLAAHSGKFCRLDVTGESGLSGWLEELGMPLVGTVTTMVRGVRPQPDPAAQVHAIPAQALG